ncbi:hypothetical protein M0812_03258 [Anaeramoeba flamelloides]|uniref:Uncharacterized protein n=1 Tax=Anaeramoeba flamelloides TaxID=1746091 RepID=A0AAV8AH25_9EUKA|nr:hypothetical protein M0812_03258 [Anaeramoeba flamelloides]
MSQRDQNQSLTNSDLLRMEQFSSMLLGYSDQSTIKDFFSDRTYEENSISQFDQNRSFSPINIRQSLNSSLGYQESNEFQQPQEFGDELFSFKEENEINYQGYLFENMELKRDIETLQYQVDQLAIEINKETQLRNQINEELTRIKKCVNLSQQQQQQQQQLQQQSLPSKYQNNYYLKKNKSQTGNNFRSRKSKNSSKSLFLEKNNNYHLQSNQKISNNNSPKKKIKRRYSDQSFLNKNSNKNGNFQSVKRNNSFKKNNHKKKQQKKNHHTNLFNTQPNQKQLQKNILDQSNFSFFVGELKKLQTNDQN